MTMKPEFMRLRRALAGTVAALLLAAGLVVLSPAVSASAHHNTISVTAACVNHQWTITWKITNSEYDKSETITHSSDESVIAVGTVIDRAGTYTKTETVSGPVDKTLTVTAKWSNGYTQTNAKTVRKSDFVGTCAPAETPKVIAAATGCVAYGTNDGTVSFTLSGVSKSYTVELRQGATVIQSTTSSGGSGAFAGVAPGKYTVKAWTAHKSVQTDEFEVLECAPNTPIIALLAAPCVTGGALGAVTAKMTNLNTGITYRLTLHSADGTVLETKDHTATSASFETSFTKRGTGTYYATAAIGNGPVMATSANAVITDCPRGASVTVQLEPCAVSTGDSEREISVQVDGLAASTVYTVQLVTDDAARTVIASTTTAGGTISTFTHTFTGVPAGAYKVEVLGGSTTLVSDTVTAAGCGLDTLAPPSIEVLAASCEGVGSAAPAPLRARMIDLDPASTYYVRIVDGSGAAVTGGQDRTVTGVATATVAFPGITAPGTYTAQLLVDPGKQLAATSPASSGVRMCLPTLAMTGPGELIPLGGVAALLLTLGGAVVMGRLRRRMAL